MSNSNHSMKAPISSVHEAKFADVVWSGVAVAIAILLALALAGKLSAVSAIVSTVLIRINRTLGAAPSADSQVYWYMARVSGVIAYLLLWASVMWGLMLTNKVLKGVLKPLVTFELHQFLSVLSLAFSGFHAFILLGDRYIAFDVAALLIPFKSTYEPLWVGLGILSFYLMAILIVSFYFKKRMGHKVWRLLHYASFLGWVMVTFHGLMAGSDTRTPVMLMIYVVSTVSISFLTSYRILNAKIRQRLST